MEVCVFPWNLAVFSVMMHLHTADHEAHVERCSSCRRTCWFWHGLTDLLKSAMMYSDGLWIGIVVRCIRYCSCGMPAIWEEPPPQHVLLTNMELLARDIFAMCKGLVSTKEGLPLFWQVVRGGVHVGAASSCRWAILGWLLDDDGGAPAEQLGQLAAGLHQDNTPQLQRWTLLVQLLVPNGIVIHRLSCLKRLMPGRQALYTVGGGVPLRQPPTTLVADGMMHQLSSLKRWMPVLLRKTAPLYSWAGGWMPQRHTPHIFTLWKKVALGKVLQDWFANRHDRFVWYGWIWVTWVYTAHCWLWMVLGRLVGEGDLPGAMGKYGRSNIWQRMARVYCSLCGAAGLWGLAFGSLCNLTVQPRCYVDYHVDLGTRIVFGLCWLLTEASLRSPNAMWSKSYAEFCAVGGRIAGGLFFSSRSRKHRSSQRIQNPRT